MLFRSLLLGFPLLLLEEWNDSELGVVEVAVGQPLPPRFDDGVVVLRELGGDEEVGDTGEFGEKADRVDEDDDGFVVGASRHVCLLRCCGEKSSSKPMNDRPYLNKK